MLIYNDDDDDDDSSTMMAVWWLCETLGTLADTSARLSSLPFITVQALTSQVRRVSAAGR